MWVEEEDEDEEEDELAKELALLSEILGFWELEEAEDMVVMRWL